MTHFRTSVATPETDTQLLCATQLITRPGTLPTITIPLAGGRQPDVDHIWQYLKEPAEFFGMPMPAPKELAVALAEFLIGVGHGLVATTVTIVEGAPRILVSGMAVRPCRLDPVRVTGDDSGPQAHRVTDPWWRRMAARTTSKAALDQRERWLNGRGYVDSLAEGMPVLGALVFDTAGGVVGVENAEPTSVLDQLAQCGVMAPVRRVTACPINAERVWWVSPRYQCHPVAELDGTRFAVETDGDVAAVPPFARWS